MRTGGGGWWVGESLFAPQLLSASLTRQRTLKHCYDLCLLEPCTESVMPLIFIVVIIVTNAASTSSMSG